MGGKAARSAVEFLPDGANAYPAYNIALAVGLIRRSRHQATCTIHTVNVSTFSNAARSVSGVSFTGSA